jgi:hypothetical protein
MKNYLRLSFMEERLGHMFSQELDVLSYAAPTLFS